MSRRARPVARFAEGSRPPLPRVRARGASRSRLPYALWAPAAPGSAGHDRAVPARARDPRRRARAGPRATIPRRRRERRGDPAAAREPRLRAAVVPPPLVRRCPARPAEGASCDSQVRARPGGCCVPARGRIPGRRAVAHRPGPREASRSDPPAGVGGGRRAGPALGSRAFLARRRGRGPCARECGGGVGGHGPRLDESVAGGEWAARARRARRAGGARPRHGGTRAAQEARAGRAPPARARAREQAANLVRAGRHGAAPRSRVRDTAAARGRRRPPAPASAAGGGSSRPARRGSTRSMRRMGRRLTSRGRGLGSLAARRPAHSAPGMRRSLVVLIVDALGWRSACETPGFAPSLPHRRRIETILGFSSGALPTLFTGRMPSEHGRWLMFQRARARSPFAGFHWTRVLPPRVQRSEALRRMLSRVVERRGVRGYFHLYDVPRWLLPQFDIAEREDIFAPGGLPVDSLWDAVERRGLSWRRWNWRTPEAENLQQIERCVASAEPAVMVCYTAELDAALHHEGTNGAGVRTRLGRYSALLERLAAVGAAADRAPWLYLVADHGMVDVSATVDVMGRLARLPVRWPRDYLAFFDSTMARFWWRGARARALVREALGPALHGRWLTSAERMAAGVSVGGGGWGGG